MTVDGRLDIFSVLSIRIDLQYKNAAKTSRHFGLF